MAAIESVLNEHFPDDKSVFYDGGKYFARSIEYYADKSIPHKPQIVTIPKANYIAVRGKGNPNEEGGEYKAAIGVLMMNLQP